MLRGKGYWQICCLLLLMVLLAGCFDNTTVKEPDALPEGFLTEAERIELIPFQGTDLYTAETVNFDVAGQERVRILSFFSPG